MIRTVLIDYDGTLHDTDSVFASKLDGLLGLEGGELYRIYLFEIHRKIVHERYPERHDDLELHWRLLLRYLGRPYDGDTVRLLNIRFQEAVEEALERPRFFPDALPFLEHLAEAGYRLVLSTGQNSLRKAEAVRRAGGRDYFHRVLGEEILGYLKNDPAYYREALRVIDARAEETVSVGDTILTDIYPAKAVGIGTIWVNRRGEEAPREPERTPDHEVPDLSSALERILSL